MFEFTDWTLYTINAIESVDFYKHLAERAARMNIRSVVNNANNCRTIALENFTICVKNLNDADKKAALELLMEVM